MNNVILPVIPETVTVHLGPANSPAENVTVSFPDYIKNVASSEIYPTWPENAIRANIYAQISFALNRIYTEFYRSRGYDFDITNSTANDQFFVKDRDIFENISQIVDEIFNSYVVRSGSFEPLFTQYCNGTTATCPGLSQWGTVSLANSGLSPLEILRNYYGNNVEIVSDVPVEAITASVPSRPLRLGSAGSDVESIQLRLNRISLNYPAIPKINPINGVFGQDTEEAVRAFQRIFNLTEDGIVGNSTWYRIQFIYNGVKRLSELDSEGLSLEEITRQFPENLSEGSTGRGVDIVQYFLSYISLYNNEIPGVDIDGVFGAETRNAVEAFQSYAGLPVTGIVDEPTYSSLYDVYRGIILSIPESLFVGRARPFPGFDLTRGQRGTFVLSLQEYLNVISEVFPDIPGVTPDGIFGQQTENAVRAFQTRFGYPVTGIAGLTTWDAIASLYDDIVKGESTSDGQYPGENSFR